MLQQLLLLPPQEVQLLVVCQDSLLPLKFSQSLRVVFACIQLSMAQDPASKSPLAEPAQSLVHALVTDNLYRCCP